MNLFRTREGFIDSESLKNLLAPLQLKGRHVIVYSRLLSLGRLLSKEAVISFLDILIEEIGEEGTLVIPTYTLNTYTEPRFFDFEKSKITAGVLGELAAQHPAFSRTVHPVYSNAVTGKHTDLLLEQDSTTCFGNNSFFDLFTGLENAYVLMLGLSFSGPTLYHYYDQKYAAKGRFVKSFQVKLKIGEQAFNSRFDSYVRDRECFDNKTNCLARFDALAEEFKLVKRVAAGEDHIHLISEKDFQNLYRSALEVDQEYFLYASNEEWNEYYLKNNFSLYHSDVDAGLVKKVADQAGFAVAEKK